MSDRDDEANFARRMGELRAENGMSQSELARRMVERGFDSYSQMTVSRTEKGERPIRLTEARVIAEILGSTVEEMIRGTQLEETLRMADKIREDLIGSMLRIAQEMEQHGELLHWSMEFRSRLSRFDDTAAREAGAELERYEYPSSVVAAWAAEVARDPMRDVPEALVWTDLTRLNELRDSADGQPQATP